MNPVITRRRFLGGALASGMGALVTPPATWAAEPFVRSGPGRMLLSLAAYSFRDYFPTAQTDQPQKTAERALDMFGFLDFCAEHGCVGAELTSYYFPPEVDDRFLLSVRRHAFLRGVEISGTAVGNTFTLPKGEARQKQIALVKQWVDRAAVMGAPHVRVFAGDAGPLTAAQAQQLCVEGLEECADHAAAKGVFLGIENHGGIVAEPDALLEIVRAVRSSWVGINLDTGNFHTDDPYAALKQCAPYAVNVQLKVEMQPRGKPRETADLERVIGILREAHYQGYVVLEYEAAEDPWRAVPKWLAKLENLV